MVKWLNGGKKESATKETFLLIWTFAAPKSLQIRSGPACFAFFLLPSLAADERADLQQPLLPLSHVPPPARALWGAAETGGLPERALWLDKSWLLPKAKLLFFFQRTTMSSSQPLQEMKQSCVSTHTFSLTFCFLVRARIYCCLWAPPSSDLRRTASAAAPPPPPCFFLSWQLDHTSRRWSGAVGSPCLPTVHIFSSFICQAMLIMGPPPPESGPLRPLLAMPAGLHPKPSAEPQLTGLGTRGAGRAPPPLRTGAKNTVRGSEINQSRKSFCF